MIDRVNRTQLLIENIGNFKDYNSRLQQKINSSKEKGEDTNIYNEDIDALVDVLGYLLDCPHCDIDKETFEQKYDFLRKRMDIV